MTNTIAAAAIEVAVESSGVDRGLAQVDAAVERTGRTLATLGERGRAAMDGVASSSTSAATKLDGATKSLIGSVERATAALQAGKKGSAEYFESLARARGVDSNALAPFIAQLREVEVVQQKAAESANQMRAAQEAAAMAARAEARAQQEASQAATARSSFLNELREQIRLYGKSSEEVLKFRAAQAGAAADAAPLILQLQNIRAAHDSAAAAAKRQADAERQAAQVQTNRNNFIESLRQQSEAIGKTRVEMLQLQAAQLGVTDQAAPFIARLREAEQGLGRAGISAGQTAFALRQVPAQITDIVTSLQGGQAPLTVFLQQGGQLRDMFGSVGAAARALGSQLLSLATNPYVIVAAAVGGVALAYSQGSKEADSYNRTLILTGNAAGTSADRLQAMAASISKTAGTQAVASEAISALAGTGRVSADNLERFGLVAVKVQRAIGQSTQDTAKDFADLAKSPLEGITRLSENYRFLTGETYKRIKSLQDQGLAEQAGEEAQKAYAQALEERSEKIVAKLGYVERGWTGVRDAAKGAWDAMLGVGREETLEEKLAKVQASLQKRQGAAQNGQKSVLGGSVGFDSSAADSETTRQLRAQEELLKEQISKRDRLAAIDAGKAQFNQADLIWAQEIEKNLNRRQQLENELAASKNRGLAAGRTDTEIETEAQKIRIKYADIYNDSIDSQIEKLKRLAGVQDSVASRAQNHLNALHDAGIVNDDDFIDQQDKLDQAAYERHKSALEREFKLAEKKQNSLKEQASIRGEIARAETDEETRKEKVADERLKLDVKRSRAAADVRAKLFEDQLAYRDSLKQQVQGQRDANEEIGLSGKALADLTAARLEDAAAERDRKVAGIEVTDETKGEIALYREQAVELRKLAVQRREGFLKAENFEQQKALWQSIDQTAHDTFINIFNGGKNAFDRLRDTLKAGLLDLLYQMTVKRWIFSIGADVSGYSAIGALGNGGVAGLLGNNPATSALQTASGLGNLYGTFAGVGGTVSGVGNLVGSSYLASVGTGLSQGAAAGEAIAAYQAAAAAGEAGAGAVASGLSLGSGISTAIAAIPGWGWAAMGAAALIGMSGLFDNGPEDHTRLTFASNNTPGNVSINERGNEGKVDQSFLGGFGQGAFGTFGVKSTFWMSENSDTVQSFIKTVTGVDNALSKFLTTTERASVTEAVTKQTITANTGAEGTNPNANGELDGVFAQRLNAIFEGVAPGLSSLLSGFKGSSQELATEAEAILQYRQALEAAGAAVFGQKTALEEIAALRQPAESTSAALNRVTAEFTATNAIALALGKSASDMFSGIGVQSEAARRQLVEAAGGVDKLTQSAASFAQNYLTEQERLKPVADQLNSILATLGLQTIPQTRDEFKRLVQSLNPLDAAQAKLLVSLFGVQDAFAQTHPAITDTTTDLTNLRDQLRTSYEKERDALQSTIDKVGSFASSLRSFRDGLLLGDLSPLTPQQKYIEARTQYERTLSAARGGDTQAQGQVTAVAQAFLGASRTANASDAQYQSDFFMVQQSIAETEKWAQSQVDIGKASLAALNTQVAGLMTINQSVLSVGQAISALTAVMGAQAASDAGGNAQSAIESLYSSLLGRHSDAEGLQFWTNALQSGVTIQHIAGEFLTSPEYLKLHGSHAAGLAYVPFDGYRAELHQGERVLTAQENINYNRIGTPDMAPLVAEIKALRAEVTQLRTEQAKQTDAAIQANFAANDRNAQAINQGLSQARNSAAWEAKTIKEAKPV